MALLSRTIYHAAAYSKKIESPPPIAVWALNKRYAQSLYPIEAPYPGAAPSSFQSISFKYTSAFNNPFLQAQAGLFVTVPFGEQIFYYERNWPDLERLLSHQNSEEPMLIKHVLAPAHQS